MSAWCAHLHTCLHCALPDSSRSAGLQRALTMKTRRSPTTMLQASNAAQHTAACSAQLQERHLTTSVSAAERFCIDAGVPLLLLAVLHAWHMLMTLLQRRSSSAAATSTAVPQGKQSHGTLRWPCLGEPVLPCVLCKSCCTC